MKRSYSCSFLLPFFSCYIAHSVSACHYGPSVSTLHHSASLFDHLSRLLCFLSFKSSHTPNVPLSSTCHIYSILFFHAVNNSDDKYWAKVKLLLCICFILSALQTWTFATSGSGARLRTTCSSALASPCCVQLSPCCCWTPLCLWRRWVPWPWCLRPCWASRSCCKTSIIAPPKAWGTAHFEVNQRFAQSS